MGLELLAGAVAALAGTGLEMYGASQSAKAENNATQNEINAQEQFANKGKQVAQGALAQSGTQVANQQQASGAAQQLGRYLALAQAPSGVKTNVDPVTQAGTQAIIGQQAGAQSQLAGLSDYFANQNAAAQQAGRGLSILGTEAGGEGATLGPKLQQAGQTGAPWQAAGSGLSTLGSLAALYGIYSNNPYQNNANAIKNLSGINSPPSLISAPNTYPQIPIA